jgi:glycosyltransferase involved in cell wall biosynthesis
LKVLWFSHSPGLGGVHLNDNYKGIGWIKSLQRTMQDKVELSLAFYHDNSIQPFVLGTTKYFPVTRYRKGAVSKISQRIFNTLEGPDDIKAFLDIIDQVKPDLIHVHGTEGPFGLIQKFTDVPVVVSIQGIITVYRYKYFSGISHATALLYSRFKNYLYFRSVFNVYQRFNKMAAREQEIYKLTKFILGRTHWDRRIASVMAPKARYFHSDEVLRAAFYQYEWNNTLSGELILFTTNGPDIYKGIETVISCAALLDSLGLNYEWQIAGFSPGDEMIGIASKSVDTAVSKNIKLLGSVDEQTLASALLKAHIYVGCSHIENSPNSLCEAQILGLPCIATHAGGTNSMLSGDGDGVLIQDGDPYSMAGAIIELKENFEHATLLGKGSRKKALRRHDPERISNELLSIYQTVLTASEL